jgi:hypothetical protein
LVLALALLGAGCTFDKSALDLGEPGTDAGPVDTAPDVSPPVDASGEDGASCVAGHTQCSGPVLQRCAGGQYQQVEVCPLGCKADEARCYTFVAANVTDGTLGGMDVDLDISTPGNITLDATTGVLSTGAFPDGVDISTEPQTDAPELFVIRARDFIVGPNTRLSVTGARALVVLASRDIHIEGILEVSARQHAGGPGGFDGGGRGADGLGPGGGGGGAKGGSLGTSSGGGGGGGNGASGGAGGVGETVGPAAAGPGTTDRTLRPLYGGSGGGGGDSYGDDGGGGGGALQLSAARTIQVLGSIVAVGGGGGGGAATGTDFGAGSGGGAGGAVLLEAPEITVSGYVALGGGGGGGAGGNFLDPTDGVAGAAGLPNGVAAQGGGPGDTAEGGGGAGGSIGSLAQNGGSGDLNGGGGGGGPGRALFASRTGHATLSPGLSPADSAGLTAESVLVKQ